MDILNSQQVVSMDRFANAVVLCANRNVNFSACNGKLDIFEGGLGNHSVRINIKISCFLWII